ncbi:hypothetical protein OIU76_027756 [Salix suchowensis]|nr:hypothetical protein OIU76_027756 [Salix suchowensis]
MATPPVPLQLPPNFEANPPPMGPTPPPQPPGTDMTGICFRDQLWLNTYPLDRNLKRDSAEKVTPMLTYYVLDGSIYQAPQLCSVFAARVGRALYYISKAFGTAASKLEKIGYVDSENEGAASESKIGKEVIDFKEVKRIDHIIASLQRKLPPAPPPPSFPEGYVPQPTTEEEKAPETQQGGEQQLPPVDPIIDQGPAKRMKF